MLKENTKKITIGIIMIVVFKVLFWHIAFPVVITVV